MSSPTAFHDAAVLALDCICTQMDAVTLELESYPGCPCRAYVSPGEPTFDNCCKKCRDGGHGQLTVYVQDVFPSDSFPSPGAFIHPCKAATHVALLVATVARCTPSQDERGRPPTPEELSANAELLSTDLHAVIKGLTCCLTAEAVPGKTKRRVQIANAGTTTVPAEGGCAAIEVRAYVEVGPVCGCPQGS